MLLTIGYTLAYDQLVPHNLQARNLVRRVFGADWSWHAVLLQPSFSHVHLSGVRRVGAGRAFKKADCT